MHHLYSGDSIVQKMKVKAQPFSLGGQGDAIFRISTILLLLIDAL